MKKLIVTAALLLMFALGSMGPAFGASAPINATVPENATIAHHPVRPSTDEIWSYVEDVIKITRKHKQFRRAGTLGDIETRNYIVDKLNEFGLENVKQDLQTFPRVEYKKWSFEVEGKKIPSFFLRNSAFTDAQGVQAEMVFVDGFLTDDMDVAGKIVVMPLGIAELELKDLVKGLGDWSYDPKKTLFKGPPLWLISSANNYPGSYNLAAKNGAVGFIAILPFDTNASDFYPDSSMIVQAKIPAMYLGKHDGAKLAKKIEQSKHLKATMTLTGSIDSNAKTANVMGILPGNTDDVVLITTHHDTGWEGGVQDTSGISVVLAMARYFAEQPGDIYRQKTLVFNFGANHFGLNYPDSNGIFRDHNPELFKNLRVVLGIEHIAKRVEAVNGKWVPTGEVDPHILWAPRDPMLRELMQKAIVDNGVTDSVMIKPGAMALIGEAKKFHFWSIPSYQILSAPPYLYDSADTIDMIAKDRLAPVTGASIDLIEQLTNVIPGAWITP